MNPWNYHFEAATHTMLKNAQCTFKNELLIELFDTEDILLDSFKCFVLNKNDIFKTSIQILESVYVPGCTI